MSIFSGKFHKLPGVKGKLTDRTPELRATMEQVDNGPKATVNRVAGITGAFSRVGRWFKAAVRPLDILYRFLAARQIIRQKHSAHASTAPAVEIEADSVIPLNKEAPLAAQPVADLTVDQNGNPSVLAKLVAYRRAALSYIKQIFMGRTAELSTAPGAVLGKYRKAVKLNRISEAEAAESAIIESRFNTIPHSYEATGCSAPAKIVPKTENIFTANHETTANISAVTYVNANREAKMQHSLSASFLFTATFLNYDGKELYSCSIHSNTDIPDPVESGAIPEPSTPPDTEQWHYIKFCGWSFTNGGDADPDALKNFSCGVVFYPAYEKELQQYTVNYYDGETLLHSVSLPYGSVPDYTHEKPGYKFMGWTPVCESITQDIDFYGTWEVTIPAFNDATWEYIDEVSRLGLASEYWKVGDIKNFSADGLSLRAQIVGFDHDNLADGSGKAGISLLITYVWKVSTRYHSNNNGVSWYSSALRTFCNNTIFAALPTDLQAVIKTVAKTDGVLIANDKCWIPSQVEVGGSSSGAYEFFSDDATKVTRRTVGYQYWLRERGQTYRYYARTVTASGAIDTNGIRQSNYTFVRFGFCI